MLLRTSLSSHLKNELALGPYPQTERPVQVVYLLQVI
jgi:hypothetical protein